MGAALTPTAPVVVPSTPVIISPTPLVVPPAALFPPLIITLAVFVPLAVILPPAVVVPLTVILPPALVITLALIISFPIIVPSAVFITSSVICTLFSIVARGPTPVPLLVTLSSVVASWFGSSSASSFVFFAPPPPFPFAFSLLLLFLSLFLAPTHNLLNGFLELGVAHVLLAHEMVVDALLCIANDEEGSTDVAHFHLLLLGSCQLCCLLEPVCFVGVLVEGLALLLELVAELHDGLRLLNLALAAKLLYLLQQALDTLVQHNHPLVRWRRSLLRLDHHTTLLVAELQSLPCPPDALLNVREHGLAELEKGIFVAFLPVSGALFILPLQPVIVNFVARTQVCFGVDEQIIRAELRKKVLANIGVFPVASILLLGGREIPIPAH